MDLLTCKWKKLAFANYIVPPEVVEKHLPPFTEIDYFNENCFVSLVGFQFKDVEIAGIKVPFHTDFEEINLRFYVKRFDGENWRKGTVFLSEIADKVALSTLANSLLRENYKTLPTKQEVRKQANEWKAGYFWQFNSTWQYIKVTADATPLPTKKGSETEFIIHRLWGYGKHNEEVTNEYNISHPRWNTYKIKDYSVNVDFAKIFGPEFSILGAATPHSVILAEGSSISVKRMDKITG